MNKQVDDRTKEVLCAIRQRKSKSFEARTKAETIIDRYIAEEVPQVRGMLFKHYGSLVTRMGIIPDDIEQVARIGIWQALASYDGKRGMALSTWTYSKCRWVFNSHISEGSLSSRHVYVSPHKVAQAFGYAPEKGRKKLTENEIEEIRHSLVPVALDDPLFAGESKNTVHDRIASTTFKSPEDSAASTILEEKVLEAVSQLPQRFKEPIIMYFYWHCTAGKIGEIMGYSRERACQVLQEACLKIGKALVRMKVANVEDLPKSRHNKFIRKNLGTFNSPEN